MKKFIVVILILLLLVVSLSFSYANEPDISSKAVILIDAETGEILFEKNADDKMYPASTTKIMTGILALENCELNEKVTVAREATLGINGSHIALEPGEVLSMQDLLYALLIESANDAAKAIAIHISGSVEEFAELMNNKAKELGAKNTSFVNPNGLHDDEHVTSAYDLALITNYAMKNETFAEIVKEYLYTIDITNKKTEPRYLKSSNRLLYSDDKILVDGKYVPIKYYGVQGVKTGYTAQAQSCLVSAATRNNRTLITVVLKSAGRNVYIDTQKLFNYGFENFTLKKLSSKNEFIDNLAVSSGEAPYVTAIVADDLKAVLTRNNADNITKQMSFNEKIEAPILKGQVLGKIEYSVEDEVVGTVNIISAMDIKKKTIPPYLDISSEKFLLKRWWTWPIIVMLIAIIILKYKQLKRRKRRRRRSLYS